MRMLPVVAALTNVALLGSTAHAQHFLQQGKVRPLGQPVLLDTTGLFLARFARAGEDVYIAGQPTERALRQLKTEGVTTVVNLRTPEEMRRVNFDEASLVKQLGMRYVYLPVRGSTDYPYSAATLDAFADAMRTTTGKLLLHCTVAWRASHLWGAYLIRERGVPVTDALAYARRINLMDEMHSGSGRQPIEDFLNRSLPELRRSAPSTTSPAPPDMGGGLPFVSPDDRYVAYVARRGGVQDVYVIRVDGTNEIRITDTPENEGQPAWLGSDVLTWRRVRDTTVVSIFSLAASGPAARDAMVHVPADAREIRPSPDGGRVLFSHGDYRQARLAVADVRGTNQREITTGAPSAFNPAWSPDGRQIAFAALDTARRLQVALVNTDGTGLRVITAFDTTEGSPQWPAWSPDGRRLAIQAGKYNRERPRENTSSIWVVDVATGRATKLAPHDRAYLDETPSWFADGRRIAFQSDRTGVMQLWAMNDDGREARQITSWRP